MKYYMTELAVSDFSASLAWYRDGLGMRIQILDEPNRFALLTDGHGSRLALKARSSNPDSMTTIHFESENLDDDVARLKSLGYTPQGDVTESPEGYRKIAYFVADSEKVVLFKWQFNIPLFEDIME